MSLHSVDYGLIARAGLQFLINVLEVSLYCVGRDMEIGSDIRRRQSRWKVYQDIQFSLGQWTGRSRCARL